MVGLPISTRSPYGSVSSRARSAGSPRRVRYHRTAPVSKRLIHAEIRRQLGVRRKIEAIVPEIRSPAFRLPSRASPIVSMDEIEDVAEQLRDAWGLGAQPISNLTNLLEAHGVRVVHARISDGWFDGLSTPQFWPNLQSHYDIEVLRARAGKQIRQDVKRRPVEAA
jgi:hypothetical protein